MTDATLGDEAGRLRALERMELMDTPREAGFDRITGLVQAVLRVPVAAVTLLDADRQWIKSCQGSLDLNMPREASFCTHTIRQREPLVIEDARLDPRFAASPLVTGAPHIVSYAGVPLSTPDGYNMGALCAIDFEPRRFDAGQIAVMQSFAALVMDEMELRRIASTDHLTGALTRRGFALEAEKAMAHYGRHGRPSTLVMLDLDHFKKINDTWGHPAGDQVLRSASAELKRLLRAGDALGRLGGEEFGLLIAEAGAEEAYDAAERFRKAIEAMVVENDPPLKATASFGVAVLDEECTTVEQWVARADAALYEAKRTGRNRTCSAQVGVEAVA